MGPLFWRLFLGLWLGSAALMVGTAAVVAMVAERKLPRMVEDRVAGLVSGAALTALQLRRVDPAAFRRHVARLDREYDIRLYLVDDAGRDLLGRAVPARMRTLERDAPRRIDVPAPGRAASVLFVDAFVEPDGRRYRALIAFDGPGKPPLSFLVSSIAWPVAFSVLLAGVISALGARYLVQPIAQLQGAVRRFATGALDHRVGDALQARHDEFSALARDFDAMADRIGALIGTQRRLMLDLSHELRSPLARLRVALELLREPGRPGALQDRMERDLDRLNTLIGELLLLARLDSPELQPAFALVDLDELLREIADDAALEAAASGHRLVYDAPPDEIAMQGDRELLRRALENVVRNALRHTPAGTEVRVALGREAGQAVVHVRDDGPGVDDALLATLFDPFVRGEHAAHDGNGLGLAIARAAVQRHGGRIVAGHGEGGRGLRIELRLPLAPA